MMSTGAEELFNLRHVSKRYGRSLALRDAHLSVDRASIHALVGHNGSGKSTLVKILTGFVSPEAGAVVEVDGEPARLTGGAITGTQRSVKVAAVHQHLGLIEEMSIVDNLSLFAGYDLTPRRRIRWRRQAERCRQMLAAIGVEGIDVTAPVGGLPPLVRTHVALARALEGWEAGEGLLVLDEATANLPDAETKQLLDMIRRLRDHGISVLFISHRIEEVLKTADKITVLRNGEVTACRKVAGLKNEDVVRLMLGDVVLRPHSATVRTRLTGRGRRLRVRHISGGDVNDVSFDVSPGEIVGLCGLPGSGHTDVPYLLAGAVPATGTIDVDGRAASLHRMSTRRAMRMGIALVPADRNREGLIHAMSVTANVTLPVLGEFSEKGRVRSSREHGYVERWVCELDIRPNSPEISAGALSGGNAQKVMLARWLPVGNAVLLLADPTVGVDIGAKRAIYEAVEHQAASGVSVLVASNDESDLVRLCDRVLILDRGTIVHSIAGEEITDETIQLAVHAQHRLPARGTEAARGQS